MKKEYVFPERWVIKVLTKEDDEILSKYINDTYGSGLSTGIGYEGWWYSNIPFKDNNNEYYRLGIAKIDSSLIEISMSQFKEYVLKIPTNTNQVIVENMDYLIPFIDKLNEKL